MYNLLIKFVRRIKKLKKAFLLWLFVLGMGYIFIELQRFLSNVAISDEEWIGFFIIFGAVIILWFIGDRLDKQEKEEQIEKNKQLIKETVKEVIKELENYKSNNNQHD